jgi:hypothetical protein
MTRDELIAALEQATGPDRNLDAEIMFNLYATPVGKREDGGPMGYIWPENNPSWSFGIRFPGKDRAWFENIRKKKDPRQEILLIERDGAFVLMNELRIPTLTASIDAALTLVPDNEYGKTGYNLTMLFEPETTYKNEALVWWWKKTDKWGPKSSVFAARTMPLAICIAALKARADA